MASRIKGITIEIGGDTTKLDKALAGTNKELVDTQRSLKDVERLLKLDPKNTQLLEQKQRLLAKAVEDTRSKLDTLRQAADGADKALERGAAYEAKYAPLKSALDQVNEELKVLKNQAADVEASFQAGELPEMEYQAFQRTLEETEERLRSLTKEKKALQKEFEGTKLNDKQFDGLQREIVQTTQDLTDLEKKLKDTEDSTSSFRNKVSGVASGAGKVSEVMKPVTATIIGLGAAAFATVPATDNLRAGLGNIEINAQNAGISLDGAARAMQNMYAVSGNLDGALEATNNLLNSGLTESNLQKAVENLAGAFIKFPETLNFESLADSFQETLASGSATGQFAELLDRLGVGAENFNAQLSMISGEVDRQNYALDVLANSGLANVYEGWRQNNEQLVASRDATFQMQISMAKLAEVLQPILTRVTEIASAFLDWFTALPSEVQTAIIIFMAFIGIISPLAGIISAIGVASTISTVAFSKWALVIAGVVIALAALAAIIAIIIGKGNEMNDTISNVVGSVSGTGINPKNTPRSGASPSVMSVQDLPHFASGGVFQPNNPMLGVLGDNPREVEVAAPRSTIVGAVLDAMDMRGGTSAVQQSVGPFILEMTMDGTVFSRVFIPYLRPGLTRAGIKLK
ncbi:MAG: hypothetical protein ACOX7N_08185 [Lawsonibacter sp.]